MTKTNTKIIIKTNTKIQKFIKILLPLSLATAILWWMYRGIDWQVVKTALTGQMDWTWMLLSMPFGVSAQIFRAMRWQQVLEPLGKRPRLSVATNSIFLSYASSLVVPRSGEILRCGILRKWEGIDISRLVGSVVTERAVDMLLILLLSVATIASQVPVFFDFMSTTGMTFASLLGRFTGTGYWVTAVCVLLIIMTILYMKRRVKRFIQSHGIISELFRGSMSVKDVKSPMLFILYSLGIWVSYYLHFYLTFRCFDFTASVGPVCAMVAFVAGSFAVLVPTPNGAGPWHFAVKTVLVLYGVGGEDGVIFALIVHTLQTLLVALLGMYALMALYFTKQNNQLITK